MKKYFLISVLAVTLPARMAAQALNPSVEVTNDFKDRALDFDKYGIELALPDSMSRFTTTFDYSVFDNPYKGAYRFNPYNVRVIPEIGEPESSVLYLNAGAGYTFSPVLQAVWSPKFSNTLTFNAYQDFNGYSGEYYGFGKGRDLSETAGFLFAADLKRLRVTLDASYRLLCESDALADGYEHTASAALRLLSKNSAGNFISYDIKFRYDYSRELAASGLGEHKFETFGTLSPSTGLPFDLYLDFDAGFTDFSAMTGRTAYYLQAVPRATVKLWKFRLNAGVRLAVIDKVHVYPDVRLHLPLSDNRVSIFIGALGAPTINSYYDFKTSDHHFNPLYVSAEVPVYSDEAINLYGGFGLCPLPWLQVEGKVSWSRLSSSPLYTTDGLVPSMVFGDYSRLRASGRILADFSNFRIDGNVCYNHSSIDALYAFTDPAFTGGLCAEYNFMSRLRTGVFADFSTARHYREYVMPLWVDLGIHAEFKVSKSLSAWLKGSNLLADRIEIIPGLARRGVCCTAGIRMEIR